MRIIIVANGAFPRTEYPNYVLRSADKIICCDGALTALEKRGIVPDVVIGDLDSVCHRALGRFTGVVVKDANQENNDLSKAFDYAVTHFPQADEISIIAATGRSEAHTIGNLSLLMEYEASYALSSKGVKVEMISDYSTAYAISDSCELHVGEGRKVSIFSPDSTLRIVSDGLQWPTDGVVFDNWWKATLNKAQKDVISLRFNHRSKVLVILD